MRPLLLLRPDWSQPARSGIDLLAAAARAREIGGTVCLLDGTHLPVRVAPDNVPVITAEGPQAAWLSAVWTATSAARVVRGWWRDRTASIARELRREWRRRAGDDRLPFDLRQRLRDMADAPFGRTEIDRFPRRLLRNASTVLRSADLVRQARVHLAAHGIADTTPLVTFESRTRPDIAAASIEFLRREGYAIAWIGDRPDRPRANDGVVDFTATPRLPLLELLLFAASDFVVCESVELQQLAYFTHTPSLLINAKEPFMAYPVPANGLYVLSTAIDLDTAQAITIDDMFTEPYFRDLRKREARGRRRGSFGYRDNTAEELIEAMKEMRAGIASGWDGESESQSRFRARVVEAAAALAAVSPHVAEWGPDDRFIGDGRLVRFQADRVS